MTEGESGFGPGEQDARDGELWEVAQASGMSRRNFLGLMALGGAGAVLAACGGGEATPANPTATPGSSQIPVAQVPLPPVGAKMVTTACDYCSVGCGYRVYTWLVGSVPALLGGILAKARDLTFFPIHGGMVGSPTLLVKGLELRKKTHE